MTNLVKKIISTKIGISIIVLVAVLAGGSLAWQYFGIAKREAKVSQEKMPETIIKDEETLAKGMITEFMDARMGKFGEGSLNRAKSHLTDNGKKSYSQIEFIDFALVGISNPHYSRYEILKLEKLNSNKFKFTVRIYEYLVETKEKGDFDYFDEELTVIKIDNNYLVDSVKRGETVTIQEITANWKTYVNTIHKFEVKYPENWLTREYSPGRQAHLSEEKRSIIISFASNQESLIGEKGINIFVSLPDFTSWELYIQAEGVICKEGIPIQNIKNLIQDGKIKQYCFTGEGLYFSSLSGRIFHFYVDTEGKQIFNQMLSTFRFLENVSLTEVIRYIPTEIPDEVYEGACDINAYSTRRRDAWRCVVGHSIYDPCFLFETDKSLVCNPYPPTGDKGILLKLTEPLPEPNIAKDKFGEGWAWLIELEDGSICRFVTGATGGINGKRMNYSCDKEDIDMWVLGELQTGTIWKAETAVVESIEGELTAKSVESVSIRTVWQ